MRKAVNFSDAEKNNAEQTVMYWLMLLMHRATNIRIIPEPDGANGASRTLPNGSNISRTLPKR